MKVFKLATIMLIVGNVSTGFSQDVSADEGCPWDVNCDGVVDMTDVILVGSHFGDSPAVDGDVNGDGLVNVADLILVGVHFGEACAPTSQEIIGIIGKDGVPMVLIPAGEFEMGDHDGDGDDDERPVHPVYLDAFYIDKYEVTNAQYRKFVQATGHREPVGYAYVNGRWQHGFKPWSDPGFNGANQPVVCVNWEDAKAYADWSGKRLPTEAEWERAARGTYVGQGNYKRHVWGDEWPPAKGAGNFSDESVRKQYPNKYMILGYDDGYVRTAPVGSFDPNGYGLYDMAGNAYEWCQDGYDRGYYSTSPRKNPTGPASRSIHVLRGGCWRYGGWGSLRVANRGTLIVPTHFSIGFRCAGDVTP